ncbi:MAG: hypothetical protein DHS20C18_43620 [Saprospiraceae bacterium]|nr:MAG: hypothetical protein DHS20C18_43620 [Saprospiraceae bacterium]
MKKIKYLAMSGLMVVLFSACGPTLSPFTQSLYEEQRWTDSELQRIQFYLSRDIILQRELTGGKSDIVSGEIKIVRGKEIEEVIIRKGTPGVFLFSPKANRFAVGFEENDNNFLIFGPSPKANNRYVLRASDWSNNTGTVTYADKKWRTSTDSAWSNLMVDLKKVNKVSRKTKVASGRKVG